MAVDELRFRSMASDAHVIVVDGPPEACATARRAAGQLEAIWTRFTNTSDVHRLNHSNGRPTLVEPMTVTLLETMKESSRITGGRFDPTMLPALLAAGYVASIDDPDAETTLPTHGLHTGIGPVSLTDVHIDSDRLVTLPATMALDAGGIGKGLAADHICAELLSRGASGALVSIGGDLAAAGVPPEADGWRVDIEDPFDPSRTIAQIMLSGGGVATSSTRSRTWQSDGGERHHTIDPTTDEPSRSDLVAVTVIAPCGWQAEVHATALLIGGTADFDAYTEAHGLEAIATTTAGITLATRALDTAPLTEAAQS